MKRRKQISESTRVPVELTARERNLILEHTFAGDEILAPVQSLGSTPPNIRSTTSKSCKVSWPLKPTTRRISASREISVPFMNISSESWRNTTMATGNPPANTSLQSAWTTDWRYE